MALLLSATSPAPGEYYFAQASAPAPPSPTATAPRFVATGDASGNGMFSARGDSTPGGVDVFNMQTAAGVLQWSMGLGVVPAGANSGNNFALYSYDDSGNFIDAAIVVDRATGNVELGGTSGGSLTVDGFTTSIGQFAAGTPATVGGGLIYANGPSGVSRVYDGIYNPPPTAASGAEVLNNSYGPTGTLLSSITYTPAASGLYSVTMEVSVDTAALAWTNGVALIVGYMGSPFPPFPINSDSYLACDSVANPAGFIFPVTGGGTITGVYKKDIVALVNLTAGVQYAAQATFSAGINLGTTGGVKFFIQPILA